MNLVVAGGTGFLGRSIVRHLADAGHSLAILTRDRRRVERDAAFEGVDAIEADVTNPGSLRGSLEGADAVVGAVQFPNHPVEVPRKGLTYDRYDRMGTEHLIAEAVRAGVTHYFYISGAGASSQSPVEWYRAKGRAEEAVRSSGLRWVALRPSWAYGPGDRALNRLLAIAKRSPVVPRLGVRRQQIMPVYVEDIGAAVALIFGRDDAWDSVYEIGGPHILTMQEVMKTMLDVAGMKRLILPVPAVAAKLGTALLVVLPRPPMTPQGIEFAIQDGLVDNSSLNALGFETRELRAGLSQYIG